jgi:hypothetical protein
MKNLRTQSPMFSLLLMTAVVSQSIGVAQTRTDSSVIDGFAPKLSQTQRRLIEDGRAADAGEAATASRKRSKARPKS